MEPIVSVLKLTDHHICTRWKNPQNQLRFPTWDDPAAGFSIAVVMTSLSDSLSDFFRASPEGNIPLAGAAGIVECSVLMPCSMSRAQKRKALAIPVWLFAMLALVQLSTADLGSMEPTEVAVRSLPEGKHTARKNVLLTCNNFC